MDCSLAGSSVHGDSPGKNTQVGCHALLQGTFPTQELNPGHVLYPLSHQGSPKFHIRQIYFEDTGNHRLRLLIKAINKDNYPQITLL